MHFGKVFLYSFGWRRELTVVSHRQHLRLFLIAICSTIAIAQQNYYFSRAAATLTHKLRSLSFKAMLRQDSKPPDSLLGVENRTMSDTYYLQLAGSMRRRTRLEDSFPFLATIQPR